MTKGIWKITEAATPIKGLCRGLGDRKLHQKRGLRYLQDLSTHCPALLQVSAPHILSQCSSASPGVAPVDTGAAMAASPEGRNGKPWWCLYGAISIGAWNAQVLGGVVPLIRYQMMP